MICRREDFAGEGEVEVVPLSKCGRGIARPSRAKQFVSEHCHAGNDLLNDAMFVFQSNSRAFHIVSRQIGSNQESRAASLVLPFYDSVSLAGLCSICGGTVKERD